MPKKKLTLKIKLPVYRKDWRRDVFSSILKKKEEEGFDKIIKDKLQLCIGLYLSPRKLRSNDVDNMLKDIMDAIQGRLEGSRKKSKHKKRLIENDNKIYKVTLEKRPLPKQAKGSGGYLFISKYKGHSK